MNINPVRKQTIINLYNNGVDKESLAIVTGYSDSAIDSIIRSDPALEKSEKNFCIAWGDMQRSFGLL